MAIMCCIQVLKPNREMSVSEFKAWLRHFDEDKDGRISLEELQEALRSLQMWFGWWKARRGMKAADSDHSGHIDKPQEMEKLVDFAKKQLHMKIYQSFSE